MNGRIVRRPHRDIVLTPETTSTAHFRVSVRCGTCRVRQPIVIAYGRYKKVWSVAWVTIFERVRCRCRCSSLADALKVERHMHDRPAQVLFVQVQTGCHCSLSG